MLTCAFVAMLSGLSFSPSVEAATPRYYLALFAYQEPRVLTRAKFSHTFGTVLKVLPGAGPTVLEAHTISWLPTDGIFRVAQFRSEPGRNFSLEETFRLAERDGLRITVWGPYEVRERFYNRFVDRKRDLDSGRFRYRAVDTLIRKTDVTDCIHAITDIDTLFNRGRYPLNRFGDRATAFIVDQLRTRGVLLNNWQTADELLPALGLEGRAVVRRQPPPEIFYPLSDLGLALRPQSRVVRRDR